MRTLVSANAAPFTDIQVRLKPGGLLLHTLGGTIEPACGAFDALIPIDHWSFCSPIACLELNKFCGNRTEIIGNLGFVEGLSRLASHDPSFFVKCRPLEGWFEIDT
jgi:hypothetical protein